MYLKGVLAHVLRLGRSETDRDELGTEWFHILAFDSGLSLAP